MNIDVVYVVEIKYCTLFQNLKENGENNEDEDKENIPNGISPKKKKKKENNRTRLSLKRNANRLTNEINKKLKTQKGEGDSVFTVSKSDENYFVLDITGSKSFHKSEAAQEITYRAKLKHPAPE